jgi:hypothetical protein
MNNTTHTKTFKGIVNVSSIGEDPYKKVSLFSVALNRHVMTNMIQNVIEVEAPSKNEARLLINKIARSQQSEVTLTKGFANWGDATLVITQIIEK